MVGTSTGELRAAAGDRLRFVLRCGVSALALSIVGIAAPAAAETSEGGDSAAAAQPNNQTDPNSTQTSSDQAADQVSDADDESIIVTGIRQSLRRSQDIKRDSEVVVDSVTAEDISSLPDRSVTETLQRIPGVTINRFAAGRDPDHFSVEGSGVVVRGLTYVRSELNGRDTFTANNGRGLSFADVPSELLGGVDVFKSPSADMVEGGIAGTVNLRTRLPLDQSHRLSLAGSVEANYGDFSDRWSPTVSVVGSARFDTDAGEFGILGSFVYSQIYSRADRIAISNYGRRTLFANGNVIANNPLDPNDATAAPVGGAACTTGAEASCVYLPRGAVMGSQDFNRERYGYSAAAQWRSPDRSMLATFQFLRSDAREAWTEHTVEVATDVVTDQGDSFAPPGTTLEFDEDGLFESGTIIAPTGWRDDQNNTAAWGGNGDERTPRYGLQTQNIRRDVIQRFITDDYSANFRWNVSSRLRLNFDYQHVDSHVTNLDTSIWSANFQSATLGINGSDLPSVQFGLPPVCTPGASCFGLQNDATGVIPSYGTGSHTSLADPFNNFWRAAMDHIEDSTGNEDAGRLDAEMLFPDTPWLESVKVGYRYADRDNTARFSTYNWGVLSEIWGGRGPVWLDDPVNGDPNTPGGSTSVGATELFDFPNFMREQVENPLAGVGRPFYASNTARDYDAYSAFGLLIGDEWRPRLGANGCPQNWVPLAQRCGVVAGSPFLPQEINPVGETNNAAYVMVRFGNDFANGSRLSGNVGLRYTRTRRISSGLQAFSLVTFQSDAQCAVTTDPNGNPITPTPFCALPADVRAQARAFANGALTPSDARLTYDYWLPSLNLKYELGNGVQFRFAYSRGIAPPEFGLTRNFYNLTLSANQEDIEAGGGRPIARSTVGNPFLRPIESSNFDFTAEWYFSDVGQLTGALFYKRLTNVLTNGTQRIPFTNNGATFDAIVTTPVNATDHGTVKGFEIAYQQVYTFLPGFLSGLGLNATYTYVDSSGVAQSTLSETDPDVAAGRVANVDTSLLPLQGLSRHSFSVQPFYERGPLSIRLAYSWRSRFLLTVRDVIVPFAPIFNEATGQLDGSIFYQVTPNIRVGVQAVNLLNEITRSSQVITATDGNITRAPRSWYMNDRRFSFIVRASF